jgi:alpha-2-macroglobulin
MKRKIFLLVLIIDVLLLLSLSSCQRLESSQPSTAIMASAPYASPKEAEPAPAQSSQKWLQMMATDINTLQMGDAEKSKNKILVVSYHPQGQTRKVDEVDEINITFSEPVAPLKKIKKNEPSLITVTPFIKGEGFWKSSTTYTYRMDEKLKLSSQYDVRFKGYTSFSGKAVAAKQWIFTTPTITLLRTKPYYKRKWQTRDQRVLVRFSQDVDPAAISNFISMKTPEGTHPFSIRYSDEKERKLLYYYARDEKYKNQFVTIIPAAQYPIASDIRVVFKYGMPSMAGNIGLQQARELTFRTFEVFNLIYMPQQFKPDAGLELRFSNPVQVKQLREKVIFEPAVEVDKSGNWHTDRIFIHGKFKPGINYKVTVPADLTDQFGNRLGTAKTFTAKCLDYTPFLVPHAYTHFVFENYLDMNIPVRVRNISQTAVYYKKLEIPEMKEILSSNYPQPKKVKTATTNRFQWKLPIKWNRNYTLGFNLEDINIKDPGFYYLKFQENTFYNNEGYIFQLTDIAMVAKYSPTQLFMVPFDMKTGQMVPGLDFKIQNFNKKGNLTGSAKGGDNGVAFYEPELSLLDNNKLSDCYIFSEPRKSFIWGQKSEMLEMWNFSYRDNMDYNYSPHHFYNHLFSFTDKHLYKGGQTVKFKALIRQVLSGEMTIPAVKSIKVEAFNSRNQSISKFEIPKDKVSDFGSFNGEAKLPHDAPTGFYRIKFNIKLVKSSIQKTLTFSVQEYKPAKFEVKVTADQTSIISGQTVSGKVNGRYLFGTPMKQTEGKSIWTITNTQFTPSGWKKYTFGTYDSHRRQTIFKKDFKLDDEGNFHFKKENVTAPGKNSSRLTLHGEVKDKDNNRIAGSRSLLVHRGEYYIGLKTGSYFFKEKKPGKLFMVTVSPKGKLFPNTTVNLKIVREEWKSFQQKDASGALRWNWKKITEDIIKEDVNLPKGTFEKEFTFEKTGYYKVYLTGKDSLNNTITTSGYFYVTGSGYVSWGVNEGRTIDLVTDKTEYKPGESMELLIKSPFETSTALITVEREKVMWHKIVNMKGNASTVNIPVSKEFMPNAYINVIIMKERTGLKWDEDGKDIGKPEFYAGYKAVKVDASENHLTIKVTANQKFYEPGDQVTLDIDVTDKAGQPVKSELCLSVVDKGVLNLVGYQLPDPFDFFWRNRPLDVKTVSTLSDVLGRKKFKEKGEDPGGDGGGAAFGSVVVRKNFKESAYYTAFLVTDAQGKGQVTFKLPDNLTTFKAMAVAGTKDHKFGRGAEDLMVKKNIILKPAVPNFSRPGDIYSAGVTVTNNSPKKLKIHVSVKAEDVLRVKGDKNVKKVTLAPGLTRAVWFKFKVDGVKTQKLTFKAASRKFSDGLYLEVPVRMPQFVEAAANFGRVDQASVKEQMIVPDGTLRELDKAEITLASSAMVGIKRNFDVLQEYPYDCLEQRLSKQYPLLGAGDFLLTYGLLDMKPEEIKKRVANLLKIMPNFQTSSGGFRYYPDSISASPYLTCYATEFLLMAKKKGYEYNKQMLRRALNYLKRVAKRTVESKYPYSKNVSLLVQAYAVYVLAEDGFFMKDAVNNLFEVRDRLPFSGIAYLVKALDLKHNLPKYMQPVLAKTMLNKMKDEPTMTHFENHEGDSWWWVHESNVKTTAIVLDALLTVYKRFPYAEKIARWLTTTTTQKRYLSTQENIRLFLAFEHYYRVFEKETPDFVAQVLFNGSPKIKETFSGRELRARTSNIPLLSFNPGETIDTEFQKQGTGMLYYLLRLKYYPIGEVEAIDRGFKVEKVYKQLNGSIVVGNRFKAGEKYLVEVTVDTKMERPFVMLDDPLPAGLKVLNPSFKTGLQLDKTQASSDSNWSGYWGHFYRSEIYFDRVQVFADYLRRGKHRWTYLVIATNAGTFTVPNTVVSEMYNPEVFGRNANRNVEVKQ